MTMRVWVVGAGIGVVSRVRQGMRHVDTRFADVFMSRGHGQVAEPGR